MISSKTTASVVTDAAFCWFYPMTWLLTD